MRIVAIMLFVFFSFPVFTSTEAVDIEVIKIREEKSPRHDTKQLDSKRFVDNGDGTVLDKNTGLIWLKDANANKFRLPLDAAKQYIQDMNNGKRPNYGYNNWRLPTINELETLTDKNLFYPALPAGHPFVNIQNHLYWSASGGSDIVDYAWVIDMGSGNSVIDYISLCNFKYFWPVRTNISQEISSGNVMASGLNEHGQLGDSTAEEEREGFSQVSGLSEIVKFAAGAEHAAAIKSDGSLWTWGRNVEGQLGDSTNIDRNLPVLVRGLWNVIDISAGIYHTVALKSDGTVWTWGRNYYGQLGDGTIEDRNAPVKIKNLSDVIRIFAGAYHTFAIRSDGTVWAWGWNNYGQLGDGSTFDSRTPVQIQKLSNIVEISSGIHHSVALKSDGTVWAWGWNTYGLLGDGSKEDSRTPVQVKELSDINSISAGMYHTIALKNDGTVWAWGKNEYGQLGTSSAKFSAATRVEGLNNVKKVTAGMYHSVALKSDGTLWTWGKNIKNKKEHLSPVLKKDISAVIDITAGKYYTLALISAKGI